MQATTIKLETPDGTMPLYQARPDDDPRGAVIVVQEAFGVNEHIEDVTNRFVAEGFFAVAPHLFYRAGGGTAPYGDWAKVMPLFEGLDDDGLLRDIDATLAHLEAQGFDHHQIGIVGFCFGGRVTFLVAARRQVGAAVGYYGGGIVTPRFPQFPPLIDEAGSLQTPWLGLFGDLDESIPVEDVERLRDTLEELATTPTSVVRYAEAGHGFNCDRRDAYDEEASADAWTRTMAWLSQNLR